MQYVAIIGNVEARELRCVYIFCDKEIFYAFIRVFARKDRRDFRS